jgi:hypothetical protein
MVNAIISFAIFAAIAGAVGYFMWTKSSLKSDLNSDGGKPL